MPGMDPPAQAGVLPWPRHGASLTMAMGPRDPTVVKDLLGPWSLHVEPSTTWHWCLLCEKG